MKKILFFLFGLIITISVYAQPPITATFEVDLSLYQGSYSTVEFYRGGQYYSMVNTIGNTYGYTTTVPGFQALNYSYKFVVDGVAETFNGTESCVGVIASDTLRIINLNTTIPAIVCWESCNACPALVPGCTDPLANNYNPIANLDNDSCLYNVTFFVDMSESNHIFDTLEINGTFNTWCGDCSQMEDANNDDIWEVTISLISGSYEYKFSADDWNIQEDLYESDDCVVGNPPYINRNLIVTGHQVLDTVCWNRCYSCDTERNFYNVAFKIDMSNVTPSYTTPEVNGTFNNWCGNCWSLDYQGNNIYSKSFNIDTSLHTFKFSSDNWNTEENLDSSLSCVALGFDSLGVLEFVNRELKLISDTIIDVCWESCNICPINGCTNPSACNYDNLATLDDGSCDLPNGCGDPLYLEYAASVTCSDFSACITLIVNGCTDMTACNYDNLATVDDGSCDLPNGCGDPLYLEYAASVTCSDFSACITLIVNGCTDMTACNYDALATIDDGSCLTVYGCVNTAAINYNSLANCPDTCIFPQVTFGCTDSIAVNYNPTATIDDNSCIYCVYGCIDILACNYDSLATCDDGSCDLPNGCGDPLYLEYNPLVTCNDTNACVIIIVNGCTDVTACNWDQLANIDNGSCDLPIGCGDPLYLEYDALVTCSDTNACITLIVNGCTDTAACNFDILANTDDNSCLLNYGCIDSLAYNYDSLAVCFDSSCVYEYNVTFQLDLRNQTSISYINPEINGEFNNWCGNCAQMTDLNNDSIWEITIPILEGSGPSSGPGWQYKFSADSWNIEENLFSGSTCTFTSSGYTNRFIEITQDTILDPVCWESCEDCFVPQAAYNVTFQVDMTNVSGFSVPEVNGEFNSWCGSCWSMTDVNGDNIWEFTTLIDTSLQEYKFSADNWTIQEDLDSNLSCALTNYDPTSPNGWGYVNRYLHINSDTILDPVCWQDCFTCSSITNFSWDCDGQGNCYDPGTGTGFYSDSIACIMNCQANTLSELNNEGDYNVYPNPTSEMIYIKSKENIDMIVIYNKIGQKVFQIDYPSIMTEIDFSGQKSDIYFMEIYNRTNIYREKVIYIH
jgi:hypothetical protein